MMEFSNEDKLWGAGLFMGVFSIFFGIFSADSDVLALGSYRSSLPTISFLSVSTSGMSIIEAFELNGRNYNSSSREGDTRSNYVLSVILATVIILMINIAVYAKYVRITAPESYIVTPLDLVKLFSLFVISASVAFYLRQLLKRI